MADSPENNRRPLPRVNSNETRELQKRAQATEKKVQGNINDIRNFGQRTEKAEQGVAENTRQVQDFKKKFLKQEQEVAQLQTDVKATDKKADKALKDSKSNTQKLDKLERSGSILNIKNSFTSLKRDFGASSKNLFQSVGSLQTNLNSSLLNFTSTEQETGQRLNTLEDSVTNLDLQLNIFKTDFAKSLQIVTTDNLQDKESIRALTENVDGLKKNELADEKEKQKQLRIGAADKRREIKENILEGAKGALKKTGSALSKTTNSLLGGFNLIDAIKTVLSKLALGLLIVKFPQLYQNLTENIEKWKRIGAVFVKNFLRPISAFFNGIVDVGLKLVKWTFKGVNLIRKAIGAIVGFTFNAGKKLISSIVGFLGRLFDIRPKPPRPGVDNTTRPPTTGSGGSNTSPDAGSRTPRPGAGAPSSDAVPQPKKPWWQRLGDKVKTSVSDGFKWAGDKAWSAGNALTGGSLDKADKIVRAQIDKAAELLEPIKGIFKRSEGDVQDALKSGDKKQLTGAIGKLMDRLNALGDPFFKNLDNFLRPAGQALAFMGPVGSKLISLLGKELRLGFPIDYLINHYLLGQDPVQALIRAGGSTLGTALTAPLAVPGSGVIGGEAGDYLVARLARDAFGADWKVDNSFLTFIPGFQALMDGTFGNSNRDGQSSGMEKVSLSTPTTSVGSNGSPSLKNNNTSPSISPAPAAQAASTVPVSQYLRKPTTKSTGSPTGSPSPAGSASPSVAQITLPPQSMDMPPQVIGDKGESLDKTPAQSIPSISPSNPAMDYLQVAAANAFEMQLV